MRREKEENRENKNFLQNKEAFEKKKIIFSLEKKNLRSENILRRKRAPNIQGAS